MKNKEEKKQVKKINFKKIGKIVKKILFLTMLVLTYFVSERLVDYLLTVDAEILKRSLNIILAVIVVLLYKKGEYI